MIGDIGNYLAGLLMQTFGLGRVGFELAEGEENTPQHSARPDGLGHLASLKQTGLGTFRSPQVQEGLGLQVKAIRQMSSHTIAV